MSISQNLFLTYWCPAMATFLTLTNNSIQRFKKSLLLTSLTDYNLLCMEHNDPIILRENG